jgi:CheY-like chemotaxis protein
LARKATILRLKKGDGLISARSVLIVDDEPLIRFFLVELLREAGYAVREASSADEAVAQLIHTQELDLLVTDVRMPGPRDGLALALWTRNHLPGAKIIVMTGYVAESGSAVAREFDGFLSKPFVPAQLRALATQILDCNPS